MEVFVKIKLPEKKNLGHSAIDYADDGNMELLFVLLFLKLNMKEFEPYYLATIFLLATVKFIDKYGGRMVFFKKYDNLRTLKQITL